MCIVATSQLYVKPWEIKLSYSKYFNIQQELVRMLSLTAISKTAVYRGRVAMS